MSDLRERLIAMVTVVESADGETFTSIDPAHERIALAAARMALEDAAAMCNVTRAEASLVAAEMTAAEWRTVSAILLWRQRTIRAAAEALK